MNEIQTAHCGLDLVFSGFPPNLEVENLNQIIENATAKITNSYFLLPVAGAGEIYRERVYVYELYHQMRILWSSEQFVINGEVSKQGHPKFPGRGPIPDLLVHEPGTDNNEAVFEIKSCNASDAGIVQDLEKLFDFRSRLAYKRAIYLVYGTDARKCLSRIVRQPLYLEHSSTLEIWLHLAPGQSALREQ